MNPETPAPPAPRLLPWPLRLLVFVALALLALLAIDVIDRHAMLTQEHYMRPAGLPSNAPRP